MNDSWQTIGALVIAALAAAWLARAALKRGRTPGCGGGECGAVSPDAKALLKKLKKN